MHVFDISHQPLSRPRYVTSIRIAHPPPNHGRLQHSRDGRFVYVGRAGDVIDTRTREIVAYLPPLAETAEFVEIDWSGGRPWRPSRGTAWVTARRASTGTGRGTSLGLAIAQAITEAHGRVVSLTNDVGASMSLSLPIDPTRPVAAPGTGPTALATATDQERQWSSR